MKRSKVIRKIFQLLLLVCITLSVNSQNENIEITKAEIIKNAWGAMFGKLKPDEIKSVYVESYFHGSKVPNKVTVKRPNLFRNETSGGGVLVFDGKQAAWARQTNDKDGNPRFPEMIDSASWRHFEIDIALIFPAFFEYPCELRGLKSFEETNAYELFVELPLGGNVSYFVDDKTFLVTRRLVSWSGDPKEELWENFITTYLDYKGILFPVGYSFEGREGIDKGLFKNVKFNVIPKDELFEIPKELKK